MQIKSEQLSKFVKKASINGAIPQILIKIIDGNMEAIDKDASNVVIVKATTQVKKGDDMILPIKNSGHLLQILGLFEGDIEMKVSEKNDILSIFNKSTQVDLTLATISFVDNAMESMPTKVIYETQPSLIPSDILKKTIRNAGIFKSKTIKIDSNGTVLNLITGDKGFDKATESIPLVSSIKATATFGDTAFKVIEVVGNIVKFNLKNDYPITIEETDGEVSSTFIIAPIINTE